MRTKLLLLPLTLTLVFTTVLFSCHQNTLTVNSFLDGVDFAHTSWSKIDGPTNQKMSISFGSPGKENLPCTVQLDEQPTIKGAEFYMGINITQKVKNMDFDFEGKTNTAGAQIAHYFSMGSTTYNFSWTTTAHTAFTLNSGKPGDYITGKYVKN